MGEWKRYLSSEFLQGAARTPPTANDDIITIEQWETLILDKQMAAAAIFWAD
jgi:hypothetical protein